MSKIVYNINFICFFVLMFNFMYHHDTELMLICWVGGVMCRGITDILTKLDKKKD